MQCCFRSWLNDCASSVEHAKIASNPPLARSAAFLMAHPVDVTKPEDLAALDAALRRWEAFKLRVQLHGARDGQGKLCFTLGAHTCCALIHTPLRHPCQPWMCLSTYAQVPFAECY